MRVEILCENERAIVEKLWVAAKTCYSPEDQFALLQQAKEKPTEEMVKLIKHVVDSGHHSVLEHVSITFLIADISRAASLQLVRHRFQAISQKSQRYCKEGNYGYVKPTTIANNKEADTIFTDIINKINDAYKKLLDLGIKAEDARSILPNACATNITITPDLREIMHMVNERTCTCAQLEIRNLFNEIARKTAYVLPFMKPYLCPKCVSLGYCNESPTRSCGRMPVKTEVINKGDK